MVLHLDLFSSVYTPVNVTVNKMIACYSVALDIIVF